MNKLFKGFKFAAIGIKQGVISERNLRIHLAAGAFAFAFAPFFLKSRVEWAVLALTIAFVLTSELLNTAFENLCDISSPNYSTGAKAAKDTAAGGVLVSAVFSIIIGIIFFFDINGFADLFRYCRSHIWYPVVLVILLILSVLFIIGGKRWRRLYSIRFKDKI